MRNLELGSVAIGGGLVATQAWASDGPNVLILARGEGGIEEKSRLDVQKAMVIDPLSSDPTVEGVRALISRVAKVRLLELQ